MTVRELALKADLDDLNVKVLGLTHREVIQTLQDTLAKRVTDSELARLETIAAFVRAKL